MSAATNNHGKRTPIRTIYECQIGRPRSRGHLYCDNSSTSFPKPRCVIDAMADFAVNVAASAGRSGYREARIAGDILHRCRRNLAQLLNTVAPERIVFTLNCSEALNIAIHGLLNTAPPGRRGDRHGAGAQLGAPAAGGPAPIGGAPGGHHAM